MSELYPFLETSGRYSLCTDSHPLERCWGRWFSVPGLTCQSEPVFHPYSRGQKDAHRSQVYIWTFHPWISSGPIWYHLFTPSLGTQRLCRFAFAYLFGISLYVLCILSLTISVLPPPFPAHLWELNFFGTLSHISSSHIYCLVWEFQAPKGEWHKPSILSPIVVEAKMSSFLFLYISGLWASGKDHISFSSSQKRTRMLVKREAQLCFSIQPH